jgi:hypothetical protein
MLAVSSKNKNIRDLYRGIHECKRGYRPRSNLEKDENGDLLAGSAACTSLCLTSLTQYTFNNRGK